MSATPAFADHSRDFADFRAVYPVLSRRAGGISLGINLTPGGRCGFGCIYCQVPRHELDSRRPDPTAAEIRAELDRLKKWFDSGRLQQQPRFQGVPKELLRLADLCVSGDGEPTLHRQFGELLPDLLQRAEQWGLPLRIITNGARLLAPEHLPGLARLNPRRDQLWLKADAWCPEDLATLSTTPESFAERMATLRNILAICPIALQLCLFKLSDRFSTLVPPEAIAETVRNWSAEFPLLQRLVIYTLARRTHRAGLTPLSDQELLLWAQPLLAKAGVPITICGERGVLLNT